ncbi:hypothetical protein [uncultured Arthrobacter sp.]|uniref:hypothetical protein n=1 Tax=uncultured Arthrobacter sp. TaxID=114050 RepID=UPI0032163B6E
MIGVIIDREKLEGWHNTPPLTGADWRKFAESLSASEFSTALLAIGDAIDRADRRSIWPDDPSKITEFQAWIIANRLDPNRVDQRQKVWVDKDSISIGLLKIDADGNVLSDLTNVPLLSTMEAHGL